MTINWIYYIMPYKDREKQREYQRVWDKNRGRTKRQALVDFVKDQPCESCGIHYPPCCMDFHHLTSEGKVGTIHSMLKTRASMDVLIDELRKCVLLCACCHRKLHKELLSLMPCSTTAVQEAVNFKVASSNLAGAVGNI